MEKIDLKDRKILYQLDMNCRQSNTQIGKAVGLSKDVVKYRIERMEKDGVIAGYWTAINTFALGYNVFRIYINFQKMSMKKKKEIIDYFVNSKNAWYVGSAKGEIDFNVILWVKNIYEFYVYWREALSKYEDFFKETYISIYVQAVDYKKSYLLNENDKDTDRELYRITCGDKVEKIDEIDVKILNELSINARVSIIELAKKIGGTSQKIMYRIENLIKKGIVKSFRVDINYPKLNLQKYKLDIYLTEQKFFKPLSEFLAKKPYMQCLNCVIGWADIEPEFIVSDINQLTSIVDELNIKFGNIIKSYSYWLSIQKHHERWLPEI